MCDLDDAEDFLISQGIGPDSNISFLGVRGLKSGTGGVDRYSPIINGISDYGILPTIIYTAVMPIIMLGVPLSGEGQIMDLREQAMLSAGDGVFASLIGTDGMIMLFTFLFWLAWINFLLGFANLIPMVPFDGGHILRDAVHSVLVKTDLLFKRNIHPIKLESWADKISNNSSFLFLFILIIPIILSYFP